MATSAVIARELRVQSRRTLTPWLRVGGAGVLAVLAGTLLFDQRIAGAEAGHRLFQNLSLTAYYLTTLGLPLLTADCISREKRGGTLGLLFLTPLRAWEVVLGKILAHGLQGVSLLGAAAPIFVVPLLLGGVEWLELVLTLMVLTTAIGLGLGAGLVASALSRRAMRASVCAVCLGLLATLPLNEFLARVLAVSPRAPLGWPLGWIDMLVLSRRPGLSLLLATGVMTLAGLGMAAMAVRLAAGRVRAHWREEPPTSEQARRSVEAWLRLWLWGCLGLTSLIAAVFLVRHPGQYPFVLLNGLSLVCLWVYVPAVRVERLAAHESSRSSLVASLSSRHPDAAAPATARRWLWLWPALVIEFLALGPGLVLEKISSSQLALALLIHFSVWCLAFTAAHCAWATRRQWPSGLAWALLASLGIFLLFSLVQGVIGFHPILAVEPQWPVENAPFSATTCLVTGPLWSASLDLPFDHPGSLDPAFALRLWLIDMGGVALLSLLAWVASWHWLQYRLVRPHQPQPAEPGRALEREFCEPIVARRWFRRRRGKLLERHPIRWLQARSWGAGLSRWGWCLAVVLAECVSLMMGFPFSRGFAEFQAVIIFILTVALTFAAAGSFRLEKETGALELILVTPIRLREFIAGRWVGLLGQFAPALGAIAACTLAYGWELNEQAMAACYWALSLWVSVPCLGLYWSLRKKSHALAWLMTLLSALLAGYLGLTSIRLVDGVIKVLANQDVNLLLLNVVILLTVQTLVAGFCCRRLARRLARREFSF